MAVTEEKIESRMENGKTSGSDVPMRTVSEECKEYGPDDRMSTVPENRKEYGPDGRERILLEHWKECGPDEPMCTFLEKLYYKQMGSGLEERAMQDAGYTEAVRIMTTAARALEQAGPEADLCALADALITAANNCSAEYGRVAYVQGFVDAVCRLQEKIS